MGLIGVLFFLFPAQAAEFQPALASEQSQLTTRSQDAEMDQFHEVARWRTIESDVYNQTLERDRQLTELDRAKKLRQTGAISQSDLDNRQFNFDQVDANLQRLNMRFKSAKLAMEIAKLRVIEEGNLFVVDVRLQVMEYRLAIAEIEKESLQSTLLSAEGARDYFKQRYENGKILGSKHIISVAALERRKSEFNDASSQVQGVRHQIESAQSILAGLRLSEERLKKP